MSNEIIILRFREAEELQVDKGLISYHLTRPYGIQLIELVLKAIAGAAPTEKEFELFVLQCCIFGQWFKQTMMVLTSIYKLLVDGLEVRTDDAATIINKRIVKVSLNENTINIETLLTDEELEHGSDA